MQPLRNASKRGTGYVCLSCRLKSRSIAPSSRTRSAASIADGLGPQSLQEADSAPAIPTKSQQSHIFSADPSESSNSAPSATIEDPTATTARKIRLLPSQARPDAEDSRAFRIRAIKGDSGLDGRDSVVRVHGGSLRSKVRPFITSAGDGEFRKYFAEDAHLLKYKQGDYDVRARRKQWGTSVKQKRAKEERRVEELIGLHMSAAKNDEQVEKGGLRPQGEESVSVVEGKRDVAFKPLGIEAVAEGEGIYGDTLSSEEFLPESRVKLNTLLQQHSTLSVNDKEPAEAAAAVPAQTSAADSEVTAKNAENKDLFGAYKSNVQPAKDSTNSMTWKPAWTLEPEPEEHTAKDKSLQKPKKIEWNDEMLAAYRLATERLVEEWTRSMPSLSDEPAMAQHNNRASPPSGSSSLPARGFARQSAFPPPPSHVHRQQARILHTSHKPRQEAAAAATSFTPEFLPSSTAPLSLDRLPKKDSPIRIQLRQWQELHGNKEDPTDRFDHDRDPDDPYSSNGLTRLPKDDISFRRQDLEEEEQQQAMAAFERSASKDLDSAPMDTRWLKMGDLVELEYHASERESIIAVFVRRVGFESQFFSMSGRWVHMPERHIQYSIPGWISPELVTPLLPYLPDPQNVIEKEKLAEEAYIEDLTVPREVSSGLVSRMVAFHTESQEIYRRHASALDNAHQILAHETNLQYGSLITAATRLLGIKEEDLPITALFTVRKALARAGFAFNIDRRSHRLTGYLQIRSIEQVSMVEEVRGWLRDWQDDMAIRSALQDGSEENERKLRRHRTPRTAQYVYDFVEKAKKIVMKSRENRDPTPFGNVGPSKTRLSITPESDCVKVTTDTQFRKEEESIVRFMEAWACSSMFLGLPRIESLPPLILHATGLYADMPNVRIETGLLFLQELGTIMPYENRVKFDQHLLLPSSQHSKPLVQLMDRLMKIQHDHNFQDSMEGLRKDWGEMAVYCIDDAGAHEIDDGISVEKADSADEWWVHVHIANPTAFFDRSHDLARMARHMGESIYMPERAYMMLPRWATSRYFSLAKNRPCLTFSVRMDGEGRVLERKAQNGIIRNVIKLTIPELRQVLGNVSEESSKELVLTVGGEPPPSRGRKSEVEAVTEERTQELRVLQRLAEKRVNVRRQAGGIFFDVKRPNVEVWQRWQSSGLAWDHPHRKGSRTVEGDPIIRIQTQGLTNWFEPNPNDATDAVVREMMLLASETAASWCAERQIPAIFRGVMRRPDQPDPDVFYREVLKPATEKTEDGTYPMHLGIQYVQSMGNTVLSSRPLRHSVVGMDYYSKVTSPLRRYGDMILHWQIEAALREEARTGQSLITQDKNADRSFLPFSTNILNTIMLGLQPREGMVQRAKFYSQHFWTSLLLFRAFHFNETSLPFYTEASPTFTNGSAKPLMRFYVHTAQYTDHWSVNGFSVDLSIPAAMLRPDRLGLESVRQGDVWECELDHVDIYRRSMVCRPVRLVERADGVEGGGVGEMRGFVSERSARSFGGRAVNAN